MKFPRDALASRVREDINHCMTSAADPLLVRTEARSDRARDDARRISASFSIGKVSALGAPAASEITSFYPITQSAFGSLRTNPAAKLGEHLVVSFRL